MVKTYSRLQRLLSRLWRHRVVRKSHDAGRAGSNPAAPTIILLRRIKMFKTIILKENELATFINSRCWGDIKEILPKGADEYLVIYWEDTDDYDFY